MNLVEDDAAQVTNPSRALVQHVTQHFGRHDHDRSVTSDGDIAGEQADVVGAVSSTEVAKLLVGQRLDGRGIEHALASLKHALDRMLGDHGLARTRWRRDQHTFAIVKRFDRLALEPVKWEVSGFQISHAGSAALGLFDGLFLVL